MTIFGEMQHKEPICRSTPKRGIPFRLMLAGLVAGNLLLMPILAEAAAQSAKPGHAPKTVVVVTTSKSATAPRVSPYTMANRQRAAESKTAHLAALQPAARRVGK